MVSENVKCILSMDCSFFLFPVLLRNKNDHATTVHMIGVAGNLYLLPRFDDVLWGRQGGVYRPEPFPPLNRGNVKIEVLPVHIEHDVEIGITVKAAHREAED